MDVQQIYEIIRENFHSKSGAYLNKGQCYEIAEIIKEKLLISEISTPLNFIREEHPASADMQAKVKKMKKDK